MARTGKDFLSESSREGSNFFQEDRPSKNLTASGEYREVRESWGNLLYRFGLCLRALAPEPALLTPEAYGLASQEQRFGAASALKLSLRRLLARSCFPGSAGFAALFGAGVTGHKTAFLKNRAKLFLIHFLKRPRNAMNDGTQLPG